MITLWPKQRSSPWSQLCPDEWAQVFIFLPLVDICRISLVNSTFLRRIRHHTSTSTPKDHTSSSISFLWHHLIQRDFSEHEIHGLSSSSSESAYLYTSLYKMENHFSFSPNQLERVMREYDNLVAPLPCCSEMQHYIRLYLQYRYFGLIPVPDRYSLNDQNGNSVGSQHVHARFVSVNSELTLAVMRLLKEREWPSSSPTKSELLPTLGVEFVPLYFKAKNPDIRLHLTLQLWMTAGAMRFASIRSTHFRGCHAAVIVIDSEHACLPRSQEENTLEACVKILKNLNHFLSGTHPPEKTVAKAAFIVSVNSWPTDAPISRKQFLLECTQECTAVPIEYFEITKDSALGVCNDIVRRLYALRPIDKLFADQPAMLITDPIGGFSSRCVVS